MNLATATAAMGLKVGLLVGPGLVKSKLPLSSICRNGGRNALDDVNE